MSDSPYQTLHRKTGALEYTGHRKSNKKVCASLLFAACIFLTCCCCCCLFSVGGLAGTFGIVYAATTETERIGFFQTFGKWNGLPLNENSAIAGGWKLHSNVSCEGSVYYLNNKTTTGMIYDVRGFLSGVQVGIEYKPNKLLDFWHQDQMNGKDFYTLKLYFVNETEICGERKSGPFGDLLMIKKLSNGFLTYPNSQSSQPFMGFKKGACMPLMGVHYWDIPTPSNTSCDDIGPVFLMYNNGLLNSFGIIMAQGPMDKIDDGWEQPPQNVFNFFFDPNYLPIPPCTYNRNVTAMHFTFNNFYALRC
eukprot:gene3147-5463_t